MDAPTITLSSMDICQLQMACVDRLQMLRAFIEGAVQRGESARADRLKAQQKHIEGLLERLVNL